MDAISIIIFIAFIPIAYGLWLPFFQEIEPSNADYVAAIVLGAFGPLSIVAYGIALLVSGKQSMGFRLW